MRNSCHKLFKPRIAPQLISHDYDKNTIGGASWPLRELVLDGNVVEITKRKVLSADSVFYFKTISDYL